MSNPAGFRFARPPALVVLALLSGGCVAETEGGRGDYSPGSEFQAAAVSVKRPDALSDCRSEWGAAHNDVSKNAPPASLGPVAPAAVLRDVVGESQAVEEKTARPVVVPLPDAPADPDLYRGVLLPDIKDR
jgi:hypothetical protein